MYPLEKQSIMNKLPRTAFLVELDALLDTRMALLYRELSEEDFELAVKSKYFTRHVDDYKNLPFEKFRGLYRDRTKALLKDAIVTKIIDMIREFAMAVISNVVSSPHHFEPVVYLNTYPYDLDDEEIAAIHDMVKLKLKNICDIEVINLSYKQMTPSFIKSNNISYLAIYDYVEYLNCHVNENEFSEVTNPDVSLVCPAIIFSRPDKIGNPIINDTFALFEEQMQPFISICYMPVSDFSANINTKLSR